MSKFKERESPPIIFISVIGTPKLIYENQNSGSEGEILKIITIIKFNDLINYIYIYIYYNGYVKCIEISTYIEIAKSLEHSEALDIYTYI